jgi:hypothetical protein
VASACGTADVEYVWLNRSERRLDGVDAHAVAFDLTGCTNVTAITAAVAATPNQSQAHADEHGQTKSEFLHGTRIVCVALSVKPLPAPGSVFRSEVPPEQCRPDRDTRPGIYGAREARSYVPCCMQAFDRPAAHVQHNDAPSLYRDFLAERPQGGLHHVAFASARLDEAIAQGEALGTPVVTQWTDQLGGRYVYLEPTSASESYVELLEATPTLLGFFEQIEKAARFWDGDEPHRIVGE